MPSRGLLMAALTLIAATTALACSGSDAGTSSGVTVSDSAGVSTVQIDDLAALPLPERTTTTSVEIGRLTVLDPGGDVVETRPLPPPSRVVDLEPLTVGDDGRVLAVFGASRIFQRDGIRRDTVPLLLVDSASTADTLGLWPGRQWSFASANGGALRREFGFGRSLEASGRDGRVAIGSTDRLSLTIVDGTGDETYPAFSGLLLDADGRIWIGGPEVRDAVERRWTALAPDGTPRFRVTLPAAAELLDAAGDRLVVLDEAELGEEIVRILTLDAPEDPEG